MFVIFVIKKENKFLSANETYDDDEEPPPYPGSVVAPSLYDRQSSVPITSSCSSRAISLLLFNGSRRKSQGDLDRPLDRYSRNLRQPVSSFGTGRDPLRRTSSFSRSPSPLVGICYRHSNMSLPGCTGGLRQTNSAYSRQEQLSGRRFNRLCRNEQCQADCHHRKNRESWPSEQQLKQIRVYDGEDQGELSRNSSCLTLNYVNDPPPYPQTEERPYCDSVTLDESALASCSSNSTTKKDAITSSEYSTDRIVASETSRLCEITFDNNDCLASHNNFSTSNCETLFEHESGCPDEFRLETCLQEHQENSSHTSCTVVKDGHENYDPTVSEIEHNNESSCSNTPWQRRFLPVRRRERTLQTAAGEEPDSLTNIESRFFNQNANETEGNSVLPGQALVT